MSEQQNVPSTTIMSEWRMRLIGAPIDGAPKPPTFGITVTGKGYVNLTVYTNLPKPNSDKYPDKITPKFSFDLAFVLAQLIRAAVASKGGFRRTLRNTDFIYFGKDKKSEKPMHVCDVAVVKDAGDHDVYLEIKSYKRPDIRFPFRPMEYHEFVDEQRANFNIEETARVYALGYANRLEEFAINNAPAGFSYRMYAKPKQPTIDDKSSGLVIGSIANNPRFTVFTNVISDEVNNKGMIFGKIDVGTMWAYCEKLREAYKLSPGTTIGWKNYGRPEGADGRRSADKLHESTIVIGKNESGVIFTATVSTEQNRPNIMFPFELQNTWELLDENDQPVGPEKTSVIVSMAAAEMLPMMIARDMTVKYEPPVYNPAEGRRMTPSATRSYNNNSTSQQQSYQQPQQQYQAPSAPSVTEPPLDFDTDIPF